MVNRNNVPDICVGDMISRREAIDIVQGYAEQLQGYIGMSNDSEVYAYARGLLLSIDRNIKVLPSAQPDLSDYSDKLWRNAYERGKREAQTDTDRIYAELSKAYNVQGLPDEAIDIIGDLMLSLDEPSAQPEIIHCRECIYYDSPHVEKDGVRYEYKDMPKDAFDDLGTGFVNVSYGINIGGRCTRDYHVGYSEDKRVFVSEMNYCGRAERREG